MPIAANRSRRVFLQSTLAAAVPAGIRAASSYLDGPDATVLGPARRPTVGDEGCSRAAVSSLRTRHTDRGTFFVDEHGRVVTLRGVNMVDKSRGSPAFPPSEISDADVRRLAAWGFNFVRLGIQWSKLSPRRPDGSGDWLDTAYLDRVQRLVRRLADHDVYVLVDMHQDIYSHVFTGDGAPRWAIHDEGRPFVPTRPWWTRYLQPAVGAAFDSFWRDTAGVQTQFRRAWQAVAARLGDEPNVAGYDLFNEPAPGPTTLDAFERRWLTRFANRTVDAVRAVDGETPVWVEPAIYFGGGAPTRLGEVDDPADELGFSFHSYPELLFGDLDRLGARDVDLGDVGHPHVLDNAIDAGRRLGAAPVLTEFGASQSLDTVVDAVAAARDRLVSWAYWQYKPWEPTPDGWLVRDGAVSRNLAALVQPYPQAVAGTPLRCRYDRSSDGFELVYRSSPAVDADTVLYVPARTYGGAFAVSMTGCRVVARSAEYVRVRRDDGGRASVAISPA